MKLKLLLLVLALQSAWMVATVVQQERGLSSGQRVLLETRPVDPRDLLRGDYVILRYAISEVQRDRFRPPLATNLPPGQTVFVALKPAGEFHEVDFASIYPIEGAGVPVLRGQIVHNWRSGSGQEVEYGLERYYVREGTGNPTGKLTVEVAVPKSGRGLIKQVFVDGQPYAEAMKSQRR